MLVHNMSKLINNVPNPKCCSITSLMCDKCVAAADEMIDAELLENETVFNKEDTLGIPELVFGEDEEQSEAKGRIVNNVNPDDECLGIPTLEW